MGDNILNDLGTYYGAEVGSLLGVDPATGNFTVLAPLNLAYNSLRGLLSADQIAQLQAEAKANNATAATNPITGVTDQTLLDLADTASNQGIVSGGNVTGANTGSWLANAADALQGTYTGALGLPGTTPPAGTAVPGSNATGGIDWSSILETLAIGAAVLYGGYLIIQKL